MSDFWQIVILTVTGGVIGWAGTTVVRVLKDRRATRQRDAKMGEDAWWAVVAERDEQDSGPQDAR